MQKQLGRSDWEKIPFPVDAVPPRDLGKCRASLRTIANCGTGMVAAVQYLLSVFMTVIMVSTGGVWRFLLLTTLASRRRSCSFVSSATKPR